MLYPPKVENGVAVIDGRREDRRKLDMDGNLRPRVYLTEDEIAALPYDTVVWRNVSGKVTYGTVFCTKEDAACASANMRRDAGFSLGKQVPVLAGELR